MTTSKKGNFHGANVFIIQCVPEKRKTFTLLQNSVYPLSFDTCYKMYWPCMTKHEPFKMVMSKFICAEWEFTFVRA